MWIVAGLDWWAGFAGRLVPYALAADALLALPVLWALGVTPKKIARELVRLWRMMAGD